MKLYRVRPESKDVEPVEVDERGYLLDLVPGLLGVAQFEVHSAGAGYLGPALGDGRRVVLFVDEWGATNPEYRVNWRAWAVYGRSPILGPALIAPDSHEDGTMGEWPDGVQERLEAPWESGEMAWVREAMAGARARIEAMPEFEFVSGRWGE